MNTCKNILIVEDNQDIREVMADSLNEEGLDVRSAKNGREALKILSQTTEPTLIFLDLMMPIMSGWEFLDAMKSDPKFRKHKVVTISAVDSTQSLEDPTPLETVGTIRKPLSIEAVWSEVQKHCKMPHAATA